jgi:putative ABC transport system substrate-binding protein
MTSACSGTNTERAPIAAAHLPQKICVAQYVSQPLLDAVFQGFKDELNRSGFDSKRLAFSNANGDRNAAQIIADQLCRDKDCGVIFVLATPMAQTVKASCPTTTPIVFGAITDPVSAQLVASLDRPGGNLTGTSDQWPYDDQMKLIAALWKPTARVGVPFNPGEANTQYAMERTRSAAKSLGLRLVEVPVSSVGEVAQAVDSLARKIDVLYIPADNTVVAAGAAAISAADRHNIPVFAGDPGTFDAGAVVGLGVNYQDLGALNAKQALRILGGASPGTIRVEVSSQPELYVDLGLAKHFGLKLDAATRRYGPPTKTR